LIDNSAEFGPEFIRIHTGPREGAVGDEVVQVSVDLEAMGVDALCHTLSFFVVRTVIGSH
jgi:hypothetical protein